MIHCSHRSVDIYILGGCYSAETDALLLHISPYISYVKEIHIFYTEERVRSKRNIYIYATQMLRKKLRDTPLSSLFGMAILIKLYSDHIHRGYLWDIK